MTGNVLPLVAYGNRVWARTVTPADLAPYRRAVLASAARIRRWNPVNPDDLIWHLDRQSQDHRTFIIHAHHPRGEHDIVGKVNVMNVVRGRLQGGVVGYDAYDPYVGTGMFREGLALVVGLALARAPEGMSLHRLEIDVQPGNTTSAGVARSLGFTRVGHAPDLLWLDGSGQTQWRAHDLYAITREAWPAASFAAHRHLRPVIVSADGLSNTPAPVLDRLAWECGIPVLDRNEVGTADGCWDLLARSPVGGLVTGALGRRSDLREGLSRARVDPARAVVLGVAGVHLGASASDREITRVALLARSAAAG